MATDDQDHRGCRPATAARVRTDAVEIGRHRAVVAPVDVFAPEEGQVSAWTLELVARSPKQVPPLSVFRRLTARGFVPDNVTRQGPDHHQILAVRR